MRRVLSAAIAPMLMLLLVAPLTGCLQDDIGVRCQLEVDEENPDTQFNLQALDCESRVCASFSQGTAGPRCTTPCESDDDCPSNEVAGCPKFVCRVGSRVTGVSCCKFCVCILDAVVDSDPDAEICAKEGKSPKCPNI
jgi:hypothetical protein